MSHSVRVSPDFCDYTPDFSDGLALQVTLPLWGSISTRIDLHTFVFVVIKYSIDTV